MSFHEVRSSSNTTRSIALASMFPAPCPILGHAMTTTVGRGVSRGSPACRIEPYQLMEPVLVRARAQQLRPSREPQTKQTIFNMALADTDQDLIVYTRPRRLLSNRSVACLGVVDELL